MPVVEAQSPNHWTTREIPKSIFNGQKYLVPREVIMLLIRPVRAVNSRSRLHSTTVEMKCGR